LEKVQEVLLLQPLSFPSQTFIVTGLSKSTLIFHDATLKGIANCSVPSCPVDQVEIKAVTALHVKIAAVVVMVIVVVVVVEVFVVVKVVVVVITVVVAVDVGFTVEVVVVAVVVFTVVARGEQIVLPLKIIANIFGVSVVAGNEI
jgi:hypothetical protein